MRPHVPKAAPIAALLVSAIASLSCEPAATDADLAVRSDWEADARALVERIEAVHPDPWRRSSREAVLAAALRAAAPGIALESRRARFMAALALVGEGHTKPTDPKGEWTRLPLALESFPDGVFVTGVFKGDWKIASPGRAASELRPLDLAGARLAAVGGLPTDELLRRAAAYACAENGQGMRVESLRMTPLGEVLTDLGLVRPDRKVELRLELPGGGSATALVSPAAQTEPIGYVEGIEAWRKSGQRLWTAALEGGAVAYLAYNVCADTDPFAEVTGEFLDVASKKAVTDIVVDLRFNRGGNSLPFSVKVLPRIKKLAKKKRLWVLAGSGTFSSGIIALKELKVDAKATFVGSPTAEGYTSYGEVKSIALPRTGFSFITSSKLFELVRGAPEGQSILPDIQVELFSGDFIAGRDLVLERALEKAKGGE